MADLATFTRRECVIHATLLALEKEGITVTPPSPKNISFPDTEEIGGVFGVSLGSSQRCCTVQCGARSVSVPKFFADAVEFLKGYLTVEGLFRKAGSLTRQREIKAHIQAGGSLATNHKPHDVACLFKLFLRDLPDPLLTNCLAPAFTKTHNFIHQKQVACVMLLCLLLPQKHLSCLQVLCRFLHNVSSNSSQNLMDAVNLALVMAPNLLPFTASTAMGGHEQSLEASTSVVKILIEHYEQIGLVPEEISSVARQLEEDNSSDYKWKSVFTARSCNTPDGLVTDGSTGDELDSDGDLSMGVIRKKSSKKSRTRMFVHNLGNKLRSRYGNKSIDTKATLNSSPATKEHVPRLFSNLSNHNESGSSPLITSKRKADHDPHLMSASKRQAILQQSVGISKLRSGKLFRTPLNMKATKRSILRRCRHTDYGKTRKNAYLVLQPSHSIESFVDDSQTCDQNDSASVVANNHLPSTCNHTELSGPISLSKSEDDFPLVEFTMSVSAQKSINKPLTPVSSEQQPNAKNAAIIDAAKTNVPFAGGKRHNFIKSGSVPCKPLKSSISADNVKYFSATPDINFVKINDNCELHPYKFEAKSTHYPRSASDHQGLKSAYQLGSISNLLTSTNDSSSMQQHSEVLHGKSKPVDNQNNFKFANGRSSLKKSASNPVICNFADVKKSSATNGTHQGNSRGFKSSSLSPSKITGNICDINAKPRKNDTMRFEFSEPAVVQPVAAYVLEVSNPHQYSDIEKDPEYNEIYSTDEVQVRYMESQDVRKQLFADAENDHGGAKETAGSSKDEELFDNPLKHLETTTYKKCSGLLEEINSDLAEKHRYSPNYVAPLTVVQSPEYGNNEILDYTKSPQHCVPTVRAVIDNTKLQDDPQPSQLDSLVFNAQRSPDPWAMRKQAQNLSSREHVYVVTEQDSFKCANLNKANSKAPFFQISLNEADSTACGNQSSTAASSTEISISTAKPVTASTNSSDDSATLPSSHRQRSSSIHRFANPSIIANNDSHYLSGSSHYSDYILHGNRHSVDASNINTKPVSTAVSSSTIAARPKLSSAGIYKTSTMPKFYKEMVPLSRKTLNNSENVRTKIQQFEGINTQKEKDYLHKTDVTSEVQELDCSPQQHCSSLRRSGTWNFHSPAPLQKNASVQGGVRGTSRSNVRTHYSFHCPRVKSELMHSRISDLQQKTVSTSTTDEKAESARRSVGRKRVSPCNQSDSNKISRPLYQSNDSDDHVTGRDSVYAAECKVISALTLPKGKENNQQVITKNKILSEQDEGVTYTKRDSNNKSVSTARTMILREWII